MKHISKLLIALSVVFIVVGCGGKEETKESEPEVKITKPIKPVEETVEVVQQETPPPQDDMVAERVIYFDFDKSDIKAEFREIVKAHANYLSANPNKTVKIEGHCDERGTREYNMALGERRAFSVSQMLTLQGVSKSQISTVSFGEEKPEVEGHDESAWKWNRRAVFVYE
ncbi:MAG: peptidoglycan-associated lipoprotein Pal [Gammaproteobacteria bacterium]|nr:peptidoglycan-associated lipoprotein Pal [Gammaproteobacteria bacterium]